MPQSRRFRRLSSALLAAAFLMPAAMPAGVLAQEDNDARDKRIREADGRIRGYQEDGVVLESGSSAFPYFAFVALAALGAGVMFKSARRTHLD